MSNLFFGQITIVHIEFWWCFFCFSLATKMTIVLCVFSLYFFCVLDLLQKYVVNGTSFVLKKGFFSLNFVVVGVKKMTNCFDWYIKTSFVNFQNSETDIFFSFHLYLPFFACSLVLVGFFRFVIELSVLISCTEFS